jgi:hypothetical protein
MFRNTENLDYYCTRGISGTLWKYAYPPLKGSKELFDYILENTEEKAVTEAMKRGITIHKYLENPEGFHTYENVKPEGKLGEVADMAFAILGMRGYDDEVFSIDNIVLSACREIGWNTKWGNDAILKNALPQLLPLIEEYLVNKNKIAITSKDRVILENIVNNISADLRKFMFRPDADEHVFVEQEFILTEVEGKELKYPFKAKIDLLKFNHASKTIDIVDYKTSIENPRDYMEYYDIFMNSRPGPYFTNGIILQLEWYKRMLKYFLPTEVADYAINKRIIVFQTVAPYLSANILVNPLDNIMPHQKVELFMNDFINNYV